MSVYSKGSPLSHQTRRPTAPALVRSGQRIAIFAAASTGLNFGLSIYPEVAASGGPAAFLIPIVLALVLAIVFAWTWHHIVAYMAYVSRPEHMASVLVFGMILTLLSAGVSGWALVTRIGGTESVRQHQEAYLQNVQSAMNLIAANAADEVPLIQDAKAIHIALHHTAQSELRTGAVSGKPKKGKVVSNYEDVAASVGNTETEMSNQQAHRANLLEVVRREVNEAQRAIGSDDHAAFQKIVSQMSAQLDQANAIRLGDISGSLGLGFHPGEGEDDARPAIAALQSHTASLNSGLRLVDVPVFIPLEPKFAVLAYPPVLAWIAALIIEGAPFLVMFVIAGLRRHTLDDDDSVAPILAAAE